jgi:hypothetical protein
MGRSVDFLPNGVRNTVDPTSVVLLWRKHSTLVSASYALGTAQHETDFTLNEKDTEPSGYVSMGLYQIGAEEMAQVGMPLGSHDPYDLETITIIMVDLAEARLKRIMNAARLTVDLYTPPPDVWAYLALAHNQGLGACLKTIAAHGMNWSAYCARNPQLADMAAYGNDCITGGTYASILRP